jgi:hypothetical protein
METRGRQSIFFSGKDEIHARLAASALSRRPAASIACSVYCDAVPLPQRFCDVGQDIIQIVELAATINTGKEKPLFERRHFPKSAAAKRAHQPPKVETENNKNEAWRRG